MDRKRVEVLLKAITELSPEQTRSEWVQAKCPLHPWTHTGGTDNNPSFAVKLEASYDPFGNCFSCGARGAMSEWVHEIALRNRKQPSGLAYDFKTVWQMIIEAEDEMPLIKDQPTLEEVMMQETKELVWYPGWWLDSFTSAWALKWSRKYLQERNVTVQMCFALDLRADTTKMRVGFPVRDFEGELRGFHGRAVDPDDPLRYRMYPYAGSTNPIVWLGENWIDPNLPIVVVEGPFDLASVMRVYSNVTSPLFANASLEKIKRMSHCIEWVTFLDTGKAGDIGRQKIKKALPDHAVQHVVPPEGFDPGSMSEEQLREALGPYVKLRDNPYK